MLFYLTLVQLTLITLNGVLSHTCTVNSFSREPFKVYCCNFSVIPTEFGNEVFLTTITILVLFLLSFAAPAKCRVA